MKLLEALETLARQVVPDIGNTPLYLVAASEPGLPVEYRCYGCRAFTSTWLDVGLSAWLKDQGRWQGRGPAIVVNAAALRTEAATDADGDEDFADMLFRDRLTAVLVHELGHVVEAPFDLTALENFDQATTEATAVVHEWVTTDPPTRQAPWHGHGADWLRLVIHTQH